MIEVDNLTQEELRIAYNLYMKQYRSKHKDKVSKINKKYHDKIISETVGSSKILSDNKDNNKIISYSNTTKQEDNKIKSLDIF